MVQAAAPLVASVSRKMLVPRNRHFAMYWPNFHFFAVWLRSKFVMKLSFFGLRHSRPPAAPRSSSTRIPSDSNGAWLAAVLPRRQESVRDDRSASVTHHRSRRRSPARVCAWQFNKLLKTINFGLSRAAAHNDCCFFCAVYKYPYLLTYKTTGRLLIEGALHLFRQLWRQYYLYILTWAILVILL